MCGGCRAIALATVIKYCSLFLIYVGSPLGAGIYHNSDVYFLILGSESYRCGYMDYENFKKEWDMFNEWNSKNDTLRLM